ncbi:SRPBCC family protein [Chloroflexota bacterium]
MERIDKQVTVNASIERVFNYLKEPDNLLEIWSSLIQVDGIKPLANSGYYVKWSYKMAGMRFNGFAEYTKVVPNQWIIIEVKGEIFATLTWTFRENNGKTNVYLTIEYTIPVPLLGKLAEVIVRRMNEQEADLIMSHLSTRFLVINH